MKFCGEFKSAVQGVLYPVPKHYTALWWNTESKFPAHTVILFSKISATATLLKGT
jgi:hypothetical protein